MRWNLSILLVLLLICSCGRPTSLERTASRLKSGMSKSEVKQLFADFHLVVETNYSVNAMDEMHWATKFYSTNKKCASMIVYDPHNLFSLEMCALYFDTNGVIIAHIYNLND
mgnify:CR=1 FL=1